MKNLRNVVKPYVLTFCRQVCAASTPLFVPLRPLENAAADDCFQVVAEAVQEKGGSAIYGWAIWERNGALIEAEFHCVWQTESNELIDISPKKGSVNLLPEILFLPDPRRKYEGTQVDNIRKPLIPNSDIKQFIKVAEELYAELNRGEMATYHGPVHLEGRLLSLSQQFARLEQKLAHKWPLPGPPHRLIGSEESSPETP